MFVEFFCPPKFQSGFLHRNKMRGSLQRGSLIKILRGPQLALPLQYLLIPTIGKILLSMLRGVTKGEKILLIDEGG